MLTLLIVLSAVVYRVTRFAIEDTLIDTPRIWFHQLILTKSSKWRMKLYELITCKFCLSIWVAGATVIVADQYVSVPLPWFMWLATAAGALVVWNIAER